MKKTLIGLASCIALAAAPSVAGALGGVISAPTDSSWDAISGGTTTGRQLVLLAGFADELDTCGNGKPFYTVFMPTEDNWVALFADLEIDITDLAANPSVAVALLNDHIVNGSFSPEQLALSKRLVTRSGYVLSVQNIDTVYSSIPVSVDDYYVSGNQVVSAQASCNGWVYWINGVIDSANSVPSTGMNTATTTAPAAVTSSALPNTL